MLRIDLFADVICPWCFIGTRRLEQALAARGASSDVVITHRPFQLDPTTPPGGVDLVEMLRQKYGGDPRPLFAHAEAAARDTGIALDLTRQRRVYPTLAAHTLQRHADNAGVGREVADALFTSYFIEARDISDLAVLGDIAAGHGLDRDATIRAVQAEREVETTREQIEQAYRSGIRGVPYFVFDGRVAISGAQPLERFERVIDQVGEARSNG